jgi:hypothetical protein
MSVFGIVLLPDEETERHVRRLAMEQAKNKIGAAFVPHISLLHVITEESQLPALYQIVDRAKIGSRVPLEYGEFVHENRYRFWAVEKSG